MDLIVVYPKPYSIYLRGTRGYGEFLCRFLIGVWGSFQALNVEHFEGPAVGLGLRASKPDMGVFFTCQLSLHGAFRGVSAHTRVQIIPTAPDLALNASALYGEWCSI